MWRVVEHREAEKVLDKAPKEILRKYEAWKTIVEQSGPAGLRVIKGFHDESLGGQWEGFRSSRLSVQWRVIYQVNANEVAVYVARVTPHDYRR